RPVAAHIERPDGVGVPRISNDMVVVPGPPRDVVLVAEAFPALATGIRAVDGALLRLDDSVDAVGLGGRDGHTDLADGTSGQALVMGNLLPGITAVGGFV